METLYGDFPKAQIAEYKKKLHNRIHWLLIYKEEKYPLLDNYFSTVLYNVTSLSKIFNGQPEIIELVCVLQSARDLAASEDCEFKKYKKLIFDAHSLIDKIKEES